MRPSLLILTVATLFQVPSASAQSSAKSFAPKHDAQTQKILDAQFSNEVPAAKTNAQKLRLKGYSYRQLGQPVIDSASFHYTGTRGSDSLASAVWDEYYNEWGVPTASGKHRASADSIVNWAPAGAGLQVENTFVYQHDAGTNILMSEHRYPSAFNPCTKYTNTYTTTGLQATRVSWQQSGACGQYTPYMWATYNSAGSILTDSSAFAKVRYTYLAGGTVIDSFLTTYANSATATGWKYARGRYVYNSAGLLTSYEGRYFDSLRTNSQAYFTGIYVYDAQGRMDSLAQWNGPATGAPTAGSWKYSYTGSFSRPINIRRYGFTLGGTMLLNGRFGYHLNNTGNWDTVYFYNVSNGVDALVEKDPVIYNASGFIDYVSGYNYNASTGTYSSTPYDRNQYYYETYNDSPTGIPDAREAAATTPIAYPVPFTSVLNIDIAQGEAWTCLDAQGRTVAQGTGKTQLNTERWTPGLYVIRSVSQTAKLVKQ